MKFVIAFLAIVVVVVAEEKYTTKFDNINVDQILKSDRLLKNYVDCLMDERRCTPDGEELKRNLPDALKNGCSKCSENQKKVSKKVVRYIIDNKRPWWDKLEMKYDSTGSYRLKYEAELAEEGVKI